LKYQKEKDYQPRMFLPLYRLSDFRQIISGGNFMNKTVADLILEQLAEYGVKFIFGVIGDAIFPLADALSKQERIRYIQATIETAASFMASYSAKLFGTLGVCIASAGPGAVNMANGIADAYLGNAPVLCITGQVNRFYAFWD
jgi:pyruvate oxidase